MSRKLKTFEPGHGFSEEDWKEVSDNPELTQADIARAKPFSEVFPDLAARARRVRGKQKAPTKQLVSIRLDRDVIVAFRAAGEGWQGRINDVLRRAARLGARKPIE